MTDDSIFRHLDCARNIRTTAGFAFKFTVVSGIFSIVALSVNAWRVHEAVSLDLYSLNELIQPKLVTTQLALSILAFLACVIFAFVYGIISIRASAQASKQGQQTMMPVRRSWAIAACTNSVSLTHCELAATSLQPWHSLTNTYSCFLMNHISNCMHSLSLSFSFPINHIPGCIALCSADWCPTGEKATQRRRSFAFHRWYCPLYEEWTLADDD